MNILASVFNFILHIDIHLGEIIAHYGALAYAILFIIIFAETGLVFTPFLPGDSLLFAAGTFAAIDSFNITILLILLLIAAVSGDSVNYWLGRFLGQKVINNRLIPINQEHIDKTSRFYEKYGAKTIFLARFVPIIRTFAPFVAGLGKMDYRKFICYNISGGLVWVFGFTLLGYFFGNLPSVKENFSLVIIVIIIISVIPIFTELIKARRQKGKPPVEKVN